MRVFLREHLPKRFEVGSGFVVDPEDTVSRQTDVIVYDAFNCPVYRASESAGIYPSDNVAAIVEVKSRLTREQMRRAFENIAETKSLKKRHAGEPPFRTQTYGCVFAFDTDLSLERTSDVYVELVREFGLGRHPDLLVILDKAVFSLATNAPGDGGWSPVTLEGLGGSAGEGTHLAVAYVTTGEESLDHFFRILLLNLVMFRTILVVIIVLVLQQVLVVNLAHVEISKLAVRVVRPVGIVLCLLGVELRMHLGMAA